jgi:hypothetical protein
MLIGLELILAIHKVSVSATSVTAPEPAVIHAESGRKSAMKPSLNVRTVIAADLHALTMAQSLLESRKDQTPMVAVRCHCNLRNKMRRSHSHPCRSGQMALVVIIGVAYRQPRRHRNPTITYLLWPKVHTMPDILQVTVVGEPHPGNAQTQTVRMIPTTPLLQSNTNSQRHSPHISNLNHQGIHRGITATHLICPVLSQPSAQANVSTVIRPAVHPSLLCQAVRYLKSTRC